MKTLNTMTLALALLVLFVIPAHADIVDRFDDGANSYITDFGGDRDPDCPLN